MKKAMLTLAALVLAGSAYAIPPKGCGGGNGGPENFPGCPPEAESMSATATFDALAWAEDEFGFEFDFPSADSAQ